MDKDEDKNVVVKPEHYSRWEIEPITFTMVNRMEGWRSNIIKYGSRAGYKKYDGMSQVESEIVDLEKAKRYCDMRINQALGKDPSEW